MAKSNIRPYKLPFDISYNIMKNHLHNIFAHEFHMITVNHDRVCLVFFQTLLYFLLKHRCMGCINMFCRSQREYSVLVACLHTGLNSFLQQSVIHSIMNIDMLSHIVKIHNVYSSSVPGSIICKNRAPVSKRGFI